MARIGVFWNFTQGYVDAGLRELVMRGHDVLLATEDVSAGSDAVRPDGVALRNIFELKRADLDLDLALYCGWHVRSVQAARAAAPDEIPHVLFFDTQWRGSPRQWGRLPFARARLPKTYSHAFVPGARQRDLAQRIGFVDERILGGALTFDDHLFAAPLDAWAVRLPQFVFAGRLVPEKGVALLLDAYAQYRSDTSDPWALVIAGDGRLSTLLRPTPPGVDWRGHVGPRELATLFNESLCFVLPSVFEPYGVVLQEAAACGMALVASSEVGSSPEVLRDGVNGVIVPPGSTAALVRAFEEVASMTRDDIARMGAAAQLFAERVRPRYWADSLLSALDSP